MLSIKYIKEFFGYAYEQAESNDQFSNSKVDFNQTIFYLNHPENVTDQELMDAIKATAYFGLQEIKKGEYPDHVLDTECLAYAIQEGIFTHEEIAGICFDHDDTLETFCKHQLRGFPQNMSFVDYIRAKLIQRNKNLQAEIASSRGKILECGCYIKD
ncbi:hypothetical protein GF376_02120 [Candidatus Peregrinibacteria bacterium]|nr:hypothetical protein [Candidatus Peregrinibacteria bacterium]